MARSCVEWGLLLREGIPRAWEAARVISQQKEPCPERFSGSTAAIWEWSSGVGAQAFPHRTAQPRAGVGTIWLEKVESPY